MKRMTPILIVTALLLLAILTMTGIVMRADRPEYIKGGFNRNVQIHILSKGDIRGEADIDVVRLCGMTADHFYFSTMNYLTLVETNTVLDSIKLVSLSLNPNVYSRLKNVSQFEVQVDSPAITIFLKNDPAVLSGIINHPQNNYFVTREKYNNAFRISRSSIIIKGLDSSASNLIFKKINLETLKYSEEQQLTDRMNDGGFATDGQLSMEEHSGIMVYTYYYCNKLTLFDSNLNIKMRGSTIDTFRSYHANAGRLDEKDHKSGFSFKSPQKLVNGWSCVSDGRLFLHSLVRADNENKNLVSGYSVIDIYELPGCSYSGSLYVPAYKQKKLLRFEVVGHNLIVIYTGTVVIYELGTDHSNAN
jgi:hypothetical protein